MASSLLVCQSASDDADSGKLILFAEDPTTKDCGVNGHGRLGKDGDNRCHGNADRRKAHKRHPATTIDAFSLRVVQKVHNVIPEESRKNLPDREQRPDDALDQCIPEKAGKWEDHSRPNTDPIRPDQRSVMIRFMVSIRVNYSGDQPKITTLPYWLWLLLAEPSPRFTLLFRAN